MRRREFIAGLGGAVAWPLAVQGQQGDRVRRIGVLMWLDENEAKPNLCAFTQALAGMGWTEGRNVRMELRWYGDDTNRMRALAQELVSCNPTSSWQAGRCRPSPSSTRHGQSRSSLLAWPTPFQAILGHTDLRNAEI